MNDVSFNEGGLFFVFGYRGIGKTYLWKTLLIGLRSNSDIILNVTLSGMITSLLLPRARITHSKFSIPLAVNELSTCHIQ